FLRRIYWEYLVYLDEGGEPISFKEERVHFDHLVHASDILSCPHLKYSERSGAKPVLPHLLKRNNVTMLHRMQQGVRMAQVWQEAFVWYARHGAFGLATGFKAHPELNLHSEELGL